MGAGRGPRLGLGLVLASVGGWACARSAVIEAPIAPAPIAPAGLAPVATVPDAGAGDDASSKTAHDMPFAAGQAWRGTYMCAQGLTEMVLRVVKTEHYQVDLVFEFNHSDTGVQGSYEMRGEVDPAAGAVRLEGGAWHVQPPGYVTVDLEGRFASPGRLRGKVLHPSCTTFSAKKE